MPAVLEGQFGRYRILRRLGAGGMGEVYLAHDTQMDRRVALKVPQLEGREADVVLAQFHREARVAAEIRHPAVCPVYDVGAIDGVHYLTMAYIEGEPLDKLIRRAGRKSVGEALELVRRVAEALHELHSRGIVHRDLKPANVMIETAGTPVLLDFGLARSLSSQTQAMGSQTAATGTPAYMAPEQVAGRPEKIRAWTDVYALGVILFELLTGRLPFEGLNAVHYAMQVLQADRPPPSHYAPHVPLAVDALCLAMMAVEPTQRPATMQEVAARLYSLQAVPSAPAATPATLSATDVALNCPHCGKRLKITGAIAGKKVMCPGCKGRIDAPHEVPLPHTTPLQSPLSQTIPTSMGPGLAPVTVVDPLPDEAEGDRARVQQLNKLAVGICAGAAVLFGLVILTGNRPDDGWAINVLVGGTTAALFVPHGVIAYFTRRSLGTAYTVLVASAVMAVTLFPLLLWDFWIYDDAYFRGVPTFMLDLGYLLINLFLVPGLLIAKWARWSEEDARKRRRRPRRTTTTRDRRG